MYMFSKKSNYLSHFVQSCTNNKSAQRYTAKIFPRKIIPMESSYRENRLILKQHTYPQLPTPPQETNAVIKERNKKKSLRYKPHLESYFVSVQVFSHQSYIRVDHENYFFVYLVVSIEMLLIFLNALIDRKIPIYSVRYIGYVYESVYLLSKGF